MAGLSLQCGDCGALLKSVEEAQEHAELTSHTNFSESTEAVLNLVCTTCGKPCRSKTETDLHTKRTGHGDFADKTLEMAKPIDLEAPKAASAVESTAAAGGGESSQQSQEMVVPDVDKSLLEQLESMGFPPARATRALHYSGNSSIEAAINWVAEHEDDPDIDQMPMVPVNDKKESSKPALTPEEVKLKAQELRERARKKKEEEEKKMEREREKERIRIGKELLEAKRIEEDNERKRIMALRKAEKEEEKRAREKIRQRLEEDKAERRRKLGLPPEELTAPKPASPVAEKKSALMAGSAASPSLMAALLRLSSLLLLLLLSFHCPIAVVARSDGRDEANVEEFTEELLLRPLPDRKLLAHFHFESAAPPSISNGRHHHLFPKAIAQLVRKFHIRELELSFTQGRWNYERWGGSDPMSSSNAKPPGVELWALFDLHINEIDTTWKNLTHALSGLFCSSINFLESSTAYSSPDWGFLSNSSNLRYGALPREAVCTENLTPWLKLLPCRDKAGLASLLDRPSIYRGYYHSQRLRLVSTELNGIVLKQSLTVVLQPSVQRSSLDSSGEGFLQPSWSISSVFRKKVTGQCVLAKASRIFIEVERGLAAELEKLGSGDFSYNMFFELSSMPDRVIKESNTLQGQSTSTLYEYTVANYNEYKPMNVGIRWKLPLTWSGSQAPFHVNRFLMGSGNERGSVAISLKSSQSYAQHLDQSSECTVQVIVFQVVPWYVKVYYHTLQIFVDGKPQIVSDVIEKIRVSPSEDKVSPGTLEMMLRFPCNIQSAALVLDFDKGFLHIDEYPPDANQGFDIPSALISFPDFYSSRNYLIDDSLNPSPLLLEFQENNHVQSYTEVLLVPLTTPDFSMPYNVITFTCTVLALYFGSLLNVLRRRVGEEERLLKCQAEKRGLIPLLLSKLLFKIKGQTQEQSQSPSSSSSSSSIQRHKLVLKVILVAVAAVVWHYLLNDSS